MASEITATKLLAMVRTIFGTGNSGGELIFGIADAPQNRSSGNKPVKVGTGSDTNAYYIGLTANLSTGNILPIVIRNSNNVYFYKSDNGPGISSSASGLNSLIICSSSGTSLSSQSALCYMGFKDQGNNTSISLNEDDMIKILAESGGGSAGGSTVGIYITITNSSSNNS